MQERNLSAEAYQKTMSPRACMQKLEEVTARLDRPPRVLIVEDEPAVASLLACQTSAVLGTAEISMAATGKIAEEIIISGHKPDIVFLNLRLPDMSGTEVLRLLKATYPSVPGVFRMTIEQIITDLLTREGWPKVTNAASDLGHLTKGGIIKDTLAQYRGHPVTDQDLIDLTESEARAIYRTLFVDAPGFGKIPDERLRILKVDFAVNSGPGGPGPGIGAIEELQLILGVPPDGVIGPKTLAAIAAFDSSVLYKRLLARRFRKAVNIALNGQEILQFLQTHPAAQLHNLAGWTNRLLEFI